MVAGGVNQRCSSQNTPPSAGLTAMPSIFLAPALKCAKLLPVPHRNSPNRPTNKQFVRPIMKSSGSFSWFCCRGLKSPAGRRGQACRASSPPTKQKKGELFAFLLHAQTKPAMLLRSGLLHKCVWSLRLLLLFLTFMGGCRKATELPGWPPPCKPSESTTKAKPANRAAGEQEAALSLIASIR